MATNARAIGRSWGRQTWTAANDRITPARAVRARRRHGRRRNPDTPPELTIWTLDQETLRAALERDWR